MIMNQMTKTLFLLIITVMMVVGCSNNSEEESQATGHNEAGNVEKEAETNQDKHNEGEKEGYDLSNADKTTNDDGEDVYVFPLGKEGKIVEWMHQYSVIIAVNDFYITETLPDEVVKTDSIKEANDDEDTQAVIEATFKNDGKHPEHYEDESNTTNFAHSLVIRPDLERNTKENSINDGGNIHFANGEFLQDPFSLDPGEEQTIFIVFPIEKDKANEDNYYLSYQRNGDVIYAWALQEENE